MAKEIPENQCVKTEGIFGPAGLYVWVTVDNGCPTEVQASLVPRVPMVPQELARMQSNLQMLVELCNDVLFAGGPVSALVKFMMKPPAGMSRVIGTALIAALEA